MLELLLLQLTIESGLADVARCSATTSTCSGLVTGAQEPTSGLTLASMSTHLTLKHRIKCPKIDTAVRENMCAELEVLYNQIWVPGILVAVTRCKNRGHTILYFLDGHLLKHFPWLALQLCLFQQLRGYNDLTSIVVIHLDLGGHDFFHEQVCALWRQLTVSRLSIYRGSGEMGT